MGDLQKLQRLSRDIPLQHFRLSPPLQITREQRVKFPVGTPQDHGGLISIPGKAFRRPQTGKGDLSRLQPLSPLQKPHRDPQPLRLLFQIFQTFSASRQQQAAYPSFLHQLPDPADTS